MQLKKIILKKELIDTGNRLVVARGVWVGWGCCVKWVMGVKRYKLSFIKQVSPGDVMYSMMTIVNNTVFYICK